MKILLELLFLNKSYIKTRDTYSTVKNIQLFRLKNMQIVKEAGISKYIKEIGQYRNISGIYLARNFLFLKLYLLCFAIPFIYSLILLIISIAPNIHRDVYTIITSPVANAPISVIIIFILPTMIFLVKYILDMIFISKYSYPLLIDHYVNIILLISEIGNTNQYLLDPENLGPEDLEELKALLYKLTSGIKQEKEEKIVSKYDHTDMYPDLRRRKEMLQSIESASILIEYNIPKFFHSKDINTNKWFKESMKLVAAALREKKKWILTPLEDTYENLLAIMVLNLSYLLNGNWGLLDHLDHSMLERTNIKQNVARVALQLLKSLIFSLIPVISFVVWQNTPFAVSGTSLTIVIALLFLWVGITFLVRHDPDISNKITLMKNSRDLFTSK